MSVILSLLLITFSISFNVYSHGGDDGPSALEEEFSKLSHIHLPMNYNTHHGLHWGYELGKEDTDDAGDDHHGRELNIHPVFFGGLDQMKRLTCMSESQNPHLEVCPEDAPYLLLENKKWDLGLGVEGDFHLSIPSLSAGVGASLIYGKNYYSLRTLNFKGEKRRPLKLPLKREELNHWRKGDQLTYLMRGSLVLSAFIGIEPFFHVGPEIIQTGIYRVSVRMLSPERLDLELAILKSSALGVEANAIVANGELTFSKGQGKSFIYEFDLTDEKSFSGIQSFFAGRLDQTNKKLLHSNGKIRLKSNVKNQGVSLSGNFGIPMLYAYGGGIGRYVSVAERTETEEEEEDEHDEHFEHHEHQYKIYSTIKIRENFTRGVLSHHLWNNRSQVTSLVRNLHEKNESIIASNFSWSWSKDEVNVLEVRRKIEKMFKYLGKKDVDISLPQKLKGYLKIDLTLSLSGREILNLLNTKSLDRLKDYGLNLAKVQGKKKNHFLLQHARLEELRNKIETLYHKKNDHHLNKAIAQMLGLFYRSDLHLQGLIHSLNQVSVEFKIEGESVKKTTYKLTL